MTYGHGPYASQPYASTPSAGGVAPVTYTYVGSGGITFAGAAITSYVSVYSYIGSGGVVFGGAAVTSHISVYTYVASGGVVFGGAAATTETDTYEGSGGIVFGGAAETSYREEVPAHGGIPGPLPRKRHEEERWHYLPGPPVHYDYEGFGGIIFGGEAKTHFVPAHTRRRLVLRPEPVEAKMPTSDAVIRKWKETNDEDEAILLMLAMDDSN